MNPEVTNSTALLATAFGLLLSGADALHKANAAVDKRTARELAVISRILEKRLANMRDSMANGMTPEKAAAAPVEPFTAMDSEKPAASN